MRKIVSYQYQITIKYDMKSILFQNLQNIYIQICVCIYLHIISKSPCPLDMNNTNTTLSVFYHPLPSNFSLTEETKQETKLRYFLQKCLPSTLEYLRSRECLLHNHEGQNSKSSTHRTNQVSSTHLAILAIEGCRGPCWL